MTAVDLVSLPSHLGKYFPFKTVHSGYNIISFEMDLIVFYSFKQFFSVGQCSDMHIRMMHIQHPAKQQQDLESFFKLREEESFCDMTFITGGRFSNEKSERRYIKVHSLVIAASSEFLKSWMETTFVPDLKVRFLQIYWKKRKYYVLITSIFCDSIRMSFCFTSFE